MTLCLVITSSHYTQRSSGKAKEGTGQIVLPIGIAVSPNGGHVYVTGWGDDAVAVFRRFGVYLPLVVR
jgi:DNA-binding beta-propeller fold protein YncE